MGAAWFGIILVWGLAYGVAWLAHRRGRLRSAWHRDIAAAGLLALATLGLFWRVVSGQGWMPADGGDLVSFIFPTYRFAAQTLATGAWPLWNPALYGGAPHVADIQAGFLYPPNLLLFKLAPDFPYTALVGLSMAHIWFAGVGMYLLLARRLALRRVAALAGGLAFMFCDALLTHFGNLNYNAVASWLPWVFWAYTANGEWRMANGGTGRGWLQDAVRGLGPAALAGVLLGVATLAGHIQVTLFIMLALAAYTILSLWLQRDDPELGRRVAFALVSLSTCLLLSLCLAAPVLLPSLELSQYTVRASWNYTQAGGYSVSPAQLVGWLIPGFLGRGPQYYWGAWPRAEVGYIGILPLILAGVALVLRRERRTWLWGGLAVASFVLALGINAIPHGWLTLLPGIGQLRAPARFVLITDFALAGLAAFGLDALLRPLEARAAVAFERVWRGAAYATAAVWAIAVPLAYLALLLVQSQQPPLIVRVSITLAAVMAFAVLLSAGFLWLTARRGEWGRPSTLGWLAAGLIFLDVASLAVYHDIGNTDPSLSFRQDAIAGFLAQQEGERGPFRIDTRTDIPREWQPDTALIYQRSSTGAGIEDIDGLANPLHLADADRFWGALGSRSVRLYDLLNVRYVIARKDAPLDWNKFVLAFDGDPKLNVYENRNFLPRAFLVTATQTVGAHDAALAALRAPGFDPTTTAVIESGSSVPAGGRGRISDLRAGPNRLSMTVNADAPVFVVVSQVWYPGWRVWLDGQPQGAPLRTNFLFQGAAVPAGAHQVELRFEPAGWRWGWIVAGATLAALCAGALLLRRRR